MPVDPRAPSAGTFEERLIGRVALLERQLRLLTSFHNGGMTAAVPVVDGLPAAGRVGRLLVNSNDSKLYLDNGTSWSPQT